MLVKAKKLKGYKLFSVDGEIGKVKEFYFDDQHWTIRYLVADTANWLMGREVLISPYSLRDVVKDVEDIFVDLTKEQIKKSPSLDSDQPVSRQFENSYNRFYGFPAYWAGAYVWGPYPYIMRDREMWKQPTGSKKTWDSHLRSTHEVDGYHVHATDGEIGHIKDFLVDTDNWTIRYLIIDTKNWWPGKKVLVAPQWIESLSWSSREVFVNLSRKAIKESAEYNDESSVNRDYEAGLYKHYERPEYWNDGVEVRKLE